MPKNANDAYTKKGEIAICARSQHHWASIYKGMRCLKAQTVEICQQKSRRVEILISLLVLTHFLGFFVPGGMLQAQWEWSSPCPVGFSVPGEIF